ncbi:hypothetical protein Tco_0261378 [Tanacetum coccineum]
MSCSNYHLNFFRKPRMSVKQVWKRKTSTQKPSSSFQSESPPLPPQTHHQSISPPSYNPPRDEMINSLHNISTFLDTHNNPSNAYTQAPPSPPPHKIYPPFHGQHTSLAIQAKEGEGSGLPSEPQPPPSTAQPTNEEPIPNVVSSSHQKTQTPMQALNTVTELPQTSEPIPNVADEAIYEEWDDRVERAATTAASLDAEKLVQVVIPGAKKPWGFPLLKQGRSMIEEINQDARVTLVQIDVEDQGRFDDETDFDAAKVLADAARKNVHTYTRKRRAVSIGSGGISTASRLVSTAEESVSVAGASMPVNTAGMVQEVNISIPLPAVVKDKGKGKMKESEDEQTKKTKLQQEQDRLGHEAVENIRVRVEADEELTQRLQAEERNKYSEVDQAKMLVDLINQRKRYFAAQKAKAKRNNPMTQAQQRNYMTNYIKHMGSHTLQQLRGYSFDEIKELFETTMKKVDEVKRIQQILKRTSFDAITPDFSITDSLSMGDEHLSTISETESDELIKSSVENLVSTPIWIVSPEKKEITHDLSIRLFDSAADEMTNYEIDQRKYGLLTDQFIRASRHDQLRQ